jgi:hypothetical protein
MQGGVAEPRPSRHRPVQFTSESRRTPPLQRVVPNALAWGQTMGK